MGFFIETLEKAKRDLSKLKKEVIVNKRGRKQTVYKKVKTEGEEDKKKPKTLREKAKKIKEKGFTKFSKERLDKWFLENYENPFLSEEEMIPKLTSVKQVQNLVNKVNDAHSDLSKVAYGLLQFYPKIDLSPIFEKFFPKINIESEDEFSANKHIRRNIFDNLIAEIPMIDYNLSNKAIKNIINYTQGNTYSGRRVYEFLLAQKNFKKVVNSLSLNEKKEFTLWFKRDLASQALSLKEHPKWKRKTTKEYYSALKNFLLQNKGKDIHKIYDQIHDQINTLSKSCESKDIEIFKKSKEKISISKKDQKAIINFIKKNKPLDDSKFHAFVEKLGINPHEAEEFVYSQLQEKLGKACGSKDIGKNIKRLRHKGYPQEQAIAVAFSEKRKKAKKKKKKKMNKSFFIDFLNKARRDLMRKVIVNKRGHKQIVYVRPEDMKEKKTGKKVEIDESAKRELDLGIENDQQLYNQQFIPIIKNIKRKIKNGTYDHTKAPKLWSYLVENGAKRYAKENFDRSTQWNKVFTKPLRDKLAQEYADYYYKAIKNGEYDNI